MREIYGDTVFTFSKYSEELLFRKLLFMNINLFV